MTTKKKQFVEIPESELEVVAGGSGGWFDWLWGNGSGGGGGSDPGSPQLFNPGELPPEMPAIGPGVNEWDRQPSTPPLHDHEQFTPVIDPSENWCDPGDPMGQWSSPQASEDIVNPMQLDLPPEDQSI